jgi:hypothetical protein
MSNDEIKDYIDNVGGQILVEDNGRFTFSCSKGYAIGIATGGDDVELYDRSYVTFDAYRLPKEGIFFRRSGEFIVFLRDIISPGNPNSWSVPMINVAKKTIKKLE